MEEKFFKSDELIARIDKHIEDGKQIYHQNIHCVGDAYGIGDIRGEEILNQYDRPTIYENYCHRCRTDNPKKVYAYLYKKSKELGCEEKERGAY